MTGNGNLKTVESLRIALAELGLDTSGHKPELKRRLRKAREKKETEQRIAKARSEEQDVKASLEKSASEVKDGKEAKAQIIPNKKHTESPATPKEQPLDYYLFFDVEATCEPNGGFTFPNEIIEFPVVLVDGKTFEIVRKL